MSAIDGSGWTARGSRCPICKQWFRDEACSHSIGQVEAWFRGAWPPQKSLEQRLEELEARVAELEQTT